MLLTYVEEKIRISDSWRSSEICSLICNPKGLRARQMRELQIDLTSSHPDDG
jgi:hypothetical protein